MSIIIAKSTFKRLPSYLNYLNHKKSQGFVMISSTLIAEELQVHPVKVRKDLASTGTVGMPKNGFNTDELIHNIRIMLGYQNCNEAILVGAGRLGKALLSYEDFEQCGVRIVAAFDLDPSVCQTEVGGKPVMHTDRLPELVQRLKPSIGVITVPAAEAQEVCQMLVEAGVLAIWNFAPIHLKAPASILVHNENLAASLALLASSLQRSLSETGRTE